MKYQFKTEPWQHQKEVLAQSWNKPYWAWLCEYGTGKTFIAINNAGLLFEYLRTIDALFVIAPNGVHTQWIEEQIPEHLPERIPRICRHWQPHDTKKFKRSLEDLWHSRYENHLKVFTVNVEALQSSDRAKAFCKNFLKSFRCLFILDESTRCKQPNAKRTKFVMNHLAPLAPYRRIMTGTNVTRSPFDLFAQYQILHKEFWDPLPNFHVFTHRYGEWKKNFMYRKSIKVRGYTCPNCNDQPEQINIKRAMGTVFPTCPSCSQVQPTSRLPKKVKTLVDNGGKFEFPMLLKYKNLEELRSRMNKYSTIVLTKDCMDLPEKIYAPIYTELNPEQKRLYLELKNNLYTEYNDQELTVANKIALTTRFQQIVGGYFPETEEQIGTTNPKLERLLYDLEDIDSPNPIIIWARFTVEIRNIANRLKQEYPDKTTTTFFGETPKADRQALIEQFKEGKIDYFVANPAVAGTGLNLQKAYIQYFYSMDFNAENRWQSEARSHRGGQTNTVLIKDVFIKGTVDDTVKKANEMKMGLAEFFKDLSIEEIV